MRIHRQASSDLRPVLPYLALLFLSAPADAQNSQRPTAPSPTPINTTVCMVARNADSIGEDIVRVRGHVYRVFDELVIRDKSCRFVLELPGAPTPGTEGEPKPEAVPRLGIAPGRNTDNLKKLLRYVNERVAPVEKGAACLVCGRYHVRATIVGHLQARTRPKVNRPVQEGSNHSHSATAKRVARHLVIQSVSNVSASDLYGKLYSPDKYKTVPPD